MKYDFIIVGQGLAGSTIALQLLERNQKVLVIDQPSENRSTAIAAGLFNPLTVRTLALSWKAEDTFPALFEFYRKWEQQLNKRFFYPKPLYVPFLSTQEQALWEKRIPNTTTWVEQAFTSPRFSQVHDPLGGLILNYSGYIDMMEFMSAVRELLQAEHAFINTRFDYEQLVCTDHGVRYQDWSAEKVIFCTGINENPFCKDLPLYPLHGETMTIIPEEPLSMMYNRGVFTAPGNDNEIRVGATYQRALTTGTTVAGQRELDEKLTALLRVPYKKIASEWGVRPTTRDRKPIVGAHPMKKNVVIFTGLGTRGGSSAPLLSAKLADLLLNNEKLEKEITIDRFLSLNM